MKLFYDAEVYSTLDKPWDSVVRFVNVTLPEMGWNKGEEEETVMDVGCGPGRLTTEFILPCFPKLRKLYALDAVPGMIEVAKTIHPHPKIEYAVADFEDRSSVEHLKGHLTKFISIHCFNRIKNQKGAFQTVYDLLKPNGEGAFLFLLHNGYYDAIMQLAVDPKWTPYFTFEVEDCVPESQLNNYNSSYFKKMAEDVGFTVRYCQEVQNVTTFPDDKEYMDFYYSVCALAPCIPKNKEKDFKSDLLQYIIEQNGRNGDGTPVDKTTTVELILKKAE